MKALQAAESCVPEIVAEHQEAVSLWQSKQGGMSCEMKSDISLPNNGVLQITVKTLAFILSEMKATEGF